MSDERKTRNPADKGVFERPKASGVWWVCYFDEKGRKHREKVGAKSLARKVYQRRKTEIQERRFFPEQIGRRDVLVTHYIDQFMDEHVRGRIKSVVHYERYASLWRESIGNRSLREVVPSDIARHIGRRQKAKMAPATINRELSFLKKLFRVAVGDGLLEKNPALSIKSFKEDNARVRYLLVEEETRLKEQIPDEHWPKVMVALHTGMRRGNLFRLRWSEVNFDSGVITISRSKSGETYHVSMNDDLRAMLRTLPSRLRSPWVFPSENPDTPLDSQNFVNRVFVPALARAKISEFRWHDLRHTFASRLAMAGVDLRTIQELMGHKTIEMTIRYAHLSPAHKFDAVQRLNRDVGDTYSDTSRSDSRAVNETAVQALEVERDFGGDGWTRTTDLGIMSRIETDEKDEE